jgi:hypothetical protein
LRARPLWGAYFKEVIMVCDGGARDGGDYLSRGWWSPANAQSDPAFADR